MDDMIVSVLWMPYSHELDHLIGFLIIAVDHVSERHDPPLLESFADIVRLDEAEKIISVFILDIVVSIICESLEIREVLPFSDTLVYLRVLLVADCLICVELNVVYTPGLKQEP